MSRTTDDALLSFSRFISEIFPEYDLHIAPEEGEWKRPAIVTRLAGEAVFPPGAYHTADITQPMIVFIYPKPGKNGAQAQRDVLRAEAKLQDAIRLGVGGSGYPMRIPIYDYADTPLDQPGPVENEGYMRVNDLSTRRDPDAEDYRRWSITANLRLAWRRIMPLSSGTMVASISQTGHVQ